AAFFSPSGVSNSSSTPTRSGALGSRTISFAPRPSKELAMRSCPSQRKRHSRGDTFGPGSTQSHAPSLPIRIFIGDGDSGHERARRRNSDWRETALTSAMASEGAISSLAADEVSADHDVVEPQVAGGHGSGGVVDEADDQLPQRRRAGGIASDRGC